VVKETSGLHLAREVGLVFADPEAQFTAMTVEEELVFGLENVGYDISKIRERLEWAAEVTQIANLLDKSPYDISGGQKQRVAIACVLAMDPRIVIMDEPTSMIDPLGKQFIFDILRKLKEEGNRTIIVVEHNIEQLAPLSDQLALMHEGQIVKVAPPDEFFADPEFLTAQGVYPPEVTLLAGWLIRQRYLPEAFPMPRDLAGGVAAAQTALKLGSG
jgi:energy-coupling factor transporter ATP-binding protein EcfA2